MRKDWYDLGWLPPFRGDFSEQCRNIDSDPVNSLRRLSAHKLTESQLRKIAGICQKMPEILPGFEPFKLTVLSNANCEFLGPALRASALRHNLWLDVNVEPMGYTVAAALDSSSALNQAGADAVLLAYTHHALMTTSCLGDAIAAERAVAELVATVTTIREAVRDSIGAKTVVQTIPHAPESLFGSLDLRVPGTLNSMIGEFNRAIVASDLDVIDIARLANVIGLSGWHDVAFWHWAKLPFAQHLVPTYADYVTRYLGALRGRSRKCLVLDLDNTLWGGVIGDDGLEGIKLGQGSPLGEAYLSIQKMALDLRRRGVVLAVCSKNDESNARLPFRNHPEMLLREEHIAVFVANWNDKAANVEALAQALSLAPDALVFVDDSPTERSIIRRELPAVAVPEVPAEEPAIWPLIISAAGYFETVQFTESDLQRAEQYKDNGRRSELRTNSRDLRAYLKDLETQMEVTSFVPSHVPRISQLINKSNQFNLTTRRYSDEQVKAMERAPAVSCFAARLKDKFGDNGIISIVICKDRATDWYIDTWLMSCRVLGRQVEQALLNHVVKRALIAQKRQLIGHYIPTSKNKLVESHYEQLGFVPVPAEIDGETMWILDVSRFRPFDVPIDSYVAAEGVKVP
jgi:FkbH-like protein